MNICNVKKFAEFSKSLKTRIKAVFVFKKTPFTPLEYFFMVKLAITVVKTIEFYFLLGKVFNP